MGIGARERRRLKRAEERNLPIVEENNVRDVIGKSIIEAQKYCDNLGFKLAIVRVDNVKQPFGIKGLEYLYVDVVNGIVTRAKCTRRKGAEVYND